MRRMTRGRAVTMGLILLAASAAALPAGAASDNGGGATAAGPAPALTPDTGWFHFDFGGPGSHAYGTPFNFDTSAPAVVTVTDYSCPGDEFKVYDNGSGLGTTSNVSNKPVCSPGEGNPDIAVGMAVFSQRSFLVPAGGHSVDIKVTESPFGSGGAYIRVDTCTVYGGVSLTGTNGHDVICGTAGDDTVNALGGADLVFGLAGNDKVGADDGDDVVYGGPGKEKVTGGGGGDLLLGQEDDDRLTGDTGFDTVIGGAGSDDCLGETTIDCERAAAG